MNSLELARGSRYCIAVLITCHNRRQKTLRCLRHLFDQILPPEVELDVYVTDDGSTDGTSAAIGEEFPQVSIIHGSGALYWCGGTIAAWKVAKQSRSYDFFLWLNDDTFLTTGALAEMLETAKDSFGIVVGSCQDPTTGEWTYGGRSTKTGNKSLTGVPVVPNGTTQRCQMVNGNVVLIPKEVVDEIGLLSETFTHAIGDSDYGFRALDAGIPLLVPPRYQGVCSTNPIGGWCDPCTPFRTRLALFRSPKGINFPEYMAFSYRHFGVRSLGVGCKLIARLFFPSLWIRKKCL